MTKKTKPARYTSETALLTMELAFYQNGSLDSLKDLKAGNAAIIKTGQAMIDNKRISAGLRVYILAIMKAPCPLQLIVEAWVEFHFARVADLETLIQIKCLYTGVPYDPPKPAPEPKAAKEPAAPKKRHKRKEKVKVDPATVTNKGASFLKDALNSRNASREQKRQLKMAGSGKSSYRMDSGLASRMLENSCTVVAPLDEEPVELLLETVLDSVTQQAANV